MYESLSPNPALVGIEDTVLLNISTFRFARKLRRYLVFPGYSPCKATSSAVHKAPLSFYASSGLSCSRMLWERTYVNYLHVNKTSDLYNDTRCVFS